MSELYDGAPLATAVDFASYLKRGLSAEDTATAEQLLAAASREVRKFCRWHVWPSRADELTLDGPGTRTLFLPSAHVTAVESVTESTVELIDVTDFEWSADGMVRRLAGYAWPTGFRSVVIEFTHGFPDDPDAPDGSSGAPADLRDLVCGVAARPFDSPRGRIREFSGTVGVTYPQTGPAISGGIALTRFERENLTPYRLKAA